MIRIYDRDGRHVTYEGITYKINWRFVTFFDKKGAPIQSIRLDNCGEIVVTDGLDRRY